MTSYDIIFTPFQEKIAQDVGFFIYDGLTVTQTEDMISRRCTSYLNKAIMEFNSKAKTTVDFNNRDEIMETFNFDLNGTEIDIFIDLLYIEHMSQDITKLKVISPYLNESEISKIFSPASERKTYMDMINLLKSDVFLKIKKYNGVNRDTGKVKLPTNDTSKIEAKYEY